MLALDSGILGEVQAKSLKSDFTLPIYCSPRILQFGLLNCQQRLGIRAAFMVFALKHSLVRL